MAPMDKLQPTADRGFYITGGTLPPDAPSYVERQADRDLLQALRRGEYCYVLNSRQMGKSSLCVRTMGRLREGDIRTAFLDLTKFGGRNLTAEQWYAALLAELGRELGLRAECLAYWKEHPELPPVQRLFGAIREVALRALGVRRWALGVEDDSTGPSLTPNAQRLTPALIVFVDEIDVTRSLPFNTDEFFAAIRQCYVGRATEPVLQGVTFCLLGTATPAELIEDTRVSPFNIGRRIEVRDFTPEEAAPLAWGLAAGTAGVSPACSTTDHGAKEHAGETPAVPATDAQRLLKRILHWTGGHPYLTQRLCRAVAEARSVTPSLPRSLAPSAAVDRLCASLFLTHTAREGDDNLALVRNRLLKSEADLASLLDLYGKLRAGKGVADDETNALCGVLKLSGVAKVEAGRLVVRNRIYGEVFDRAWVTQHMPDAELRRQQAAFRLGVVRAASVAGVVLAVVVGLALTAVRQTGVAQEALRGREEANAGLRVSLAKEQAERARADENAHRADANARRANENAHRAEDTAQRNAELAQQRAQALDDALAQKQRARRLADERSRALIEAQRERDRAGDMLYASQMNLAHLAYRDGKIARAQQLLEQHRPRADAPDRRDFVWRYLRRLCRSQDRYTFPAHSAAVTAVDVSPDGRRLATGAADGAVQLWDMAGKRLLATVRAHRGTASGVTFSPDGKLLATAGAEDGTVKLWDTASRPMALRRQLPGYQRIRAQALFTPDGKTLIAGTGDDTIRLWDLASGRETPPGFRSIPVYAAGPLALSADGRTLAVVTGRQQASGITLWNITSQAVTPLPVSLPPPGGLVECVAFSSDGRMLSTGYGLWDTATGRPLALLAGQEGIIHRVTFSPDGKLLATGGTDNTIRLWDPASGQPLATLQGHTGEVWFVAFSRRGETLASASGDGTARLWDTDVTRLRGAAGGRSESEVLASGPSVGVIAFSLAFSPDGRLLAEARPREVTIWDVATRAKVGRPLSGVPGAFYGVAFAPDGKMLATGSGDGTVRLWDATARTVIGTLHGHQFWVRSLGFAAGGVLVTANGGGSGGVPASVRLWDVATRKPLAVLPADSSWPGAPIALSPDRKTVATGSPDHHVTLWDVGSRRKVATLEGVANVLSLAFSPDGKSLAGGDRDGSFHLWNLARGTRTHRPRAHLGPITAIAFSPDSQTLATGSGDRTVRLWRPGIDQEVATLIGHQRVLCVAFSPDGNLLAMGSADGTARLWQAAPLAETEAPRRASVRRTARAPAR